MKNSKKIAFGGMIGALSLVFMLLSAIFPFAEYTCPALAGITLVTLVIDFNKTTAFIAYLAVAVLSLLIVPNKEAAVLYVSFLGYYPILKSLLEHFHSRVIEWICKIGIFNVTIVLAYFVIIRVFGMEQILEDMQSLSQYGTYILLALGNVTFVIYDLALTGLIATYVNKIRPRLKNLF